MNTSVGGMFSERIDGEFHLSLTKTGVDETILANENSNYQTAKLKTKSNSSNSRKKQIKNTSVSPKTSQSMNFHKRKNSHDK